MERVKVVGRPKWVEDDSEAGKAGCAGDEVDRLKAAGALAEEPMVAPQNPTLPAKYANFAIVFKKQMVESLPPHCPDDCAIELKLGAQVPWVLPQFGRMTEGEH